MSLDAASKGAYLAVAVGGMVGGLLRMAWLESAPAWQHADLVFLLAVNTVGSGLVGLAFAFSEPGRRYCFAPEVAVGLMAGFCGALTTFSSFAVAPTVMIVGEALPWGAVARVGVSLLAWLLAAGLGLLIGRRLNPLNAVVASKN